MSQTITLDATPGLGHQVLHCHQGDVGREVKIAIVSRDGYEVPSGATVKIEATKPSGMGFTITGTATDNIVTFETTNEMTDECGQFPAQCRISSGDTLIFTSNFLLTVEGSAHPDTVVDGSIDQFIPEMTLLVERAETAAETVEEAASLAPRISAAESDIDLLDARIDQIVAPSGSAPSAAEVTDARIGANGVTYSSLGTAIRTQVTDLKSDIRGGSLFSGSQTGRYVLLDKHFPLQKGAKITVTISSISEYTSYLSIIFMKDSTGDQGYQETFIYDNYVGAYTVVLDEDYDRIVIYADEGVTLTFSIEYDSLSNRMREKVNEIGAIEASLTAYPLTQSTLFPIYPKVGDKIKVTVNSITGTTTLFIHGHTSDGVLTMTSVGEYIFTAMYDGQLQATVVSGTVDSEIFIESELSKAVEDLQTSKADLSEILAQKNLALEVGTIDVTWGSNYESTAYMRTPTYIDEATIKYSFGDKCKSRVFAYEADGTYVGVYCGQYGFTNDWSKAVLMTSPITLSDLGGESDYKYRLDFLEFTDVVSSATVDGSLLVNQVKSTASKLPKVYTVGVGKDFATFTEMLTALEGNADTKTVYVDAGTYDIFTEMGGADFIASVDADTETWDSVCKIVPPNTTIIGLGNVVLTWNPTDAQIIDQKHAFLFSPLNVAGNCVIKNIRIECSNCRYGIHDETSGRAEFNGAVHEYENVVVNVTHSTYGLLFPYCAGHNKNMRCTFKNCTFISPRTVAWSTHDWSAGANENSLFEFENCLFLRNNADMDGDIRLSSSDSVGRLDKVKIVGSVFRTLAFDTEWQATVKQGYDVETMLCKSYSIYYSDYIDSSSRVAPRNYLVIPN